MKFRTISLALTVAVALALSGCGGSGGSSSQGATGSAPTLTTETDVSQHFSGLRHGLVGLRFFALHRPSNTEYFDSFLGLWVVPSISGSSFVETFYVDQAETEPAGGLDYTLDIPTKTLSGTISVTQGKYAGLTGTYSQTLTSNGTTGNATLNIPNVANTTCQFTVQISGTGTVTGTVNSSVTLPSGYSQSQTVTLNSNGSFTVAVTDSLGYTGNLNFNKDLSGSGTINGPDPGLPAKLAWNSAGTGTVTFSNGTTIAFTNWQFLTP